MKSVLSRLNTYSFLDTSLDFATTHLNQVSVFADSDALVLRALSPERSGEPGCTQSQYLCRGSLRPAAVAWPCFALWALFTVAGTLQSLCMLTCNNWLNSGPWNRWFFFPGCLFYYANHICCSGSRRRVELAACMHSQPLSLGLGEAPPEVMFNAALFHLSQKGVLCPGFSCIFG